MPASRQLMVRNGLADRSPAERTRIFGPEQGGTSLSVVPQPYVWRVTRIFFGASSDTGVMMLEIVRFGADKTTVGDVIWKGAVGPGAYFHLPDVQTLSNATGGQSLQSFPNLAYRTSRVSGTPEWYLILEWEAQSFNFPTLEAVTLPSPPP